MNNEKVKVIKEYLRCMRGEKACWDCGLNEIAENQDTCCINLVADMALDLINELESENERIKNIGLNEEITVAEYLREMQRLKDRVAELEKEIEENAFYSKGYAQGIKNTYEVVIPDKLKQFAEKVAKRLININGIKEILDETLKEFIL